MRKNPTTALRDSSLTNADWSTAEQALLLARRQARYGVFQPGLTGIDISADAHNTTAVALDLRPMTQDS